MVEEARQRRLETPVRVSLRLPDFPWDQLTPYAAQARAHPDGIVDLSVGTPVDPTPEVVRRALAAASDSPGYPTTVGLVETRQAAADWLSRGHGVTGLGVDAVLPVIGTKELVASLPTQLGLGPGDLVVHPELAYPTYAVGAALAGTRVLAADSLTQLGPERPALLWLNSPANPTGQVLGSSTCARSSSGAASAAPCWSATSATSNAPGKGSAALGAAPRGLRRHS